MHVLGGDWRGSRGCGAGSRRTAAATEGGQPEGQDVGDHLHAELERLALVAGDGGMAYPGQVVHRHFDETSTGCDDPQHQLGSKMRSTNAELRVELLGERARD